MKYDVNTIPLRNDMMRRKAEQFNISFEPEDRTYYGMLIINAKDPKTHEKTYEMHISPRYSYLQISEYINGNWVVKDFPYQEECVFDEKLIDEFINKAFRNIAQDKLKKKVDEIQKAGEDYDA